MTIDERFRNLPPGFKVYYLDHTRDACDKENDVTITSATDGPIVLKPGSDVFFKIDDSSRYERSGGFYWKCGSSREQSRIGGADFIFAARKQNGVIDWWSVLISLDLR